MVHWVYVLECEDDFIYVGETTRLFSRLNEHLCMRGAKNTCKYRPQKLIGLYKVNDNSSFIKYRDSILNNCKDISILDNWEQNGNNLLVENHITERYFHERRENDCYGGGLEWYKVRGGKYTKSDLDDTYETYRWASEKEGRICHVQLPISRISENKIVDRPLCKCGYPSEVKLSRDKSKIYFVCSVKNVWQGFFSNINIHQACDFWKMFEETHA
jgi:predicted GIY-YIG superfamily endonuclease